MDWKQILSLTADDFENDDKKDEIYEELLFLNNSNVDNKSIKKLFKISQLILKYKGDQVTSLLSELDSLATKQGEIEAGNIDNDELSQEILNLQKTIEKLEAEKSQQKIKIKDLSEENAYLQKKLHENHFASEDEDSPDALSEIDRQQEMLNSISTKNKHIKRLLRDIEGLEKHVTDQNSMLLEVKNSLADATTSLTTITTRYNESQYYIKDQQNTINFQSAKITDLEDQMLQITQRSKQRELEIETFGQQLEDRALVWRGILNEKEVELEAVNERYNELMEKNPGYDIDADRQQLKKLSEMIKDRDNVIHKLETKLLEMTKEMIHSTNSMNKLSELRENTKTASGSNTNCCEHLKILLEKSNERCKEYQDMLTSVEEDNVLKTKQAVEAVEARHMYELGQDGLPQALKKINELQHKLNSRDKQIRALIMEVNSSNDIALENSSLRKKLGIADDDMVATDSVTAKNRKMQKINDRLTLKLRASEEMRLQLKLEKNELKRQMSMKRRSTKYADTDDAVHNLADDSIASIDERCCEKCLNQFQYTQEINNCRTCLSNQNICGSCRSTTKVEKEITKPVNSFYEDNYAIVVEENENLRIGMHEILQKLREYDAESSHITIDSSTLEKLLHALDARSITGWYHPAMRIQNELLATKEREISLRERLRTQETTIIMPSTETEKEHPHNDSDDNDIIESSNLTNIFDGKVDETVMVNEDSTEIKEIRKMKIELEDLNSKIINLLSTNEELSIFKTQYNYLLSAIDKSDEEKSKVMSTLSEDLTKIKIELLQEKRKTSFLKQDHNNFNHIIQELQNANKKIKMTYKSNITDKNNKLMESLELINQLRKNNTEATIQLVESLTHEIQTLKLQLAQQTTAFFQNIEQIDDKMLKERIDINIDVIQENLTADVITYMEFENLKSQLNKFKNESEILKTKLKYLEETLKASETQVETQKSTINKHAEVEISLRHFIADLQSNSNESYLLTKVHCELELSKSNEETLRKCVEQLNMEISDLKIELDEQKIKVHEVDSSVLIETNDTLKIRYLKKLLKELHTKYSPYTPLISLVNFSKMYAEVIELKREQTNNIKSASEHENEVLYKSLYDRIEKEMGNTGGNIKDRIETAQIKTKCDYLTKKLKIADVKIAQLQRELDEMKIKEVEIEQNWNAMNILFYDKKPKQFDVSEKGVQINISKQDRETSTDDLLPSVEKSQDITTNVSELPQSSQMQPKTVENVGYSHSTEYISQKTLESQLKQAMILASTRTSLLLETENQLATAQGRIKAIERSIEDKDNTIKDLQNKITTNGTDRKENPILSSTITSLEKILTEKETTISRYQDLLKTERQDHMKAFEETQLEIRTIKEQMFGLEKTIMIQENTIRKLESERDELVLKNQNQEGEVHLEINDNYIEHMFLEEKSEFDLEEQKFEIEAIIQKLRASEEEVERLQFQLRDVSNREKLWEKNLSDKDKEIAVLNERLNFNNYEIHQDMVNNSKVGNSRELEQLRELLEEKDKHIQDLTETLKHFHDDQQKYMNDTTLHSAEQVSILGADLNRCEATNRIMNTQIEALKRQITNVTQRDSQSRELVKTLKNQLIRRPVISMKVERNTSTREETLQKKIQKLETDLIDTKEELRRQTNLAESRKAKIDFDVWNKQKYWQQTSGKLKDKLKEKDNELEKLRSKVDSAKNTISRLEREKHVLESRVRNSRYCTSASCPNLHHHDKYAKAEGSDCFVESDRQNNEHFENHPDIIKALKSRIEMQQRRIVAMEFEGRGSNALTAEMEKMQERLSGLEAQNLRLEAKNLQLQLDRDMQKQSDDGERMKRQIKHLEEYVLVLKDEREQALSVNAMASHIPSSSNGGRMDQTILALRNVVERLKVENKHLRDRKGCMMCSKNGVSKESFEKLRSDFDQLQQKHSEALDQISSLKIDTEFCATSVPTDGDSSSDIRNVREKLNQKTQLLEKAKILLTRAAAKEKHLREQIDFWKRRCSELQNVPVIDETSEAEIFN